MPPFRDTACITHQESSVVKIHVHYYRHVFVTGFVYTAINIVHTARMIASCLPNSHGQRAQVILGTVSTHRFSPLPRLSRKRKYNLVGHERSALSARQRNTRKQLDQQRKRDGRTHCRQRLSQCNRVSATRTAVLPIWPHHVIHPQPALFYLPLASNQCCTAPRDQNTLFAVDTVIMPCLTPVSDATLEPSKPGDEIIP